MISRRGFIATAGASALTTSLPTPLAVARPTGINKLRITGVRTVEVRGVVYGKGIVLPWDPQKRPRFTRNYVVTQLFTNEGLVGTTMDGDTTLPENTGRIVQEAAEAYFIGKDPFDIARHNSEFFSKQALRPRKNFLEVALWDIIGKTCGQPLYKLWGAYSDKVPAYAATVHFDKTPTERVEDALRFYEKGFRAIKLRMHDLNPAVDLKLAQTVIEGVGDKMAVMFDANQAGKKVTDDKSITPVWDYERTLFMAKELEAMGIYWLEEPMMRDSLDDLARVRRQLTRMHLAGAEGDVGLERFRDILTKDSFSYIQPDPMVVGPVSVLRKVAAMAEAFGVLCGPHHGKSGVGMLASLHLQCAMPNTGHLEYMYDPGYWNPEGFQVGFTEPWPVDDEGYCHAPTAPGLGAPWDRGFFRKHKLEWAG
jgi:D-galactarolactone cycloisomerase